MKTSRALWLAMFIPFAIGCGGEGASVQQMVGSYTGTWELEQGVETGGISLRLAEDGTISGEFRDPFLSEPYVIEVASSRFEGNRFDIVARHRTLPRTYVFTGVLKRDRNQLRGILTQRTLNGNERYHIHMSIR
jgi:hypothetical protein